MLKFQSIYKWSNLKKNSPRSHTRNEWLFKYGCFVHYKGFWFPCRVLNLNSYGEPTILQGVYEYHNVNDFANFDLLPREPIYASDCDVVYTVFNKGISIHKYIYDELKLIKKTSEIVDNAVERSLHTEIVTTSPNLMKSVKKILNTSKKGERYVVEQKSEVDVIDTIPLQNTSDILEKLWNSKDWAKQELYELLGISYNPAQGKKERALVDEINGDRDITIINRAYITDRLIETAEEYDEKVIHMSDFIENKKEEDKYANEI